MNDSMDQVFQELNICFWKSKTQHIYVSWSRYLHDRDVLLFVSNGRLSVSNMNSELMQIIFWKKPPVIVQDDEELMGVTVKLIKWLYQGDFITGGNVQKYSLFRSKLRIILQTYQLKNETKNCNKLKTIRYRLGMRDLKFYVFASL